MEAKELRELSAEDLVQKRASLREEIGNLKLKETKRDLARLETILREKAPRPAR